MREGSAALFVCGLGRCGSSMVMGMLYAGGLPVIARERESFECASTAEALANARVGAAVKVLEPHLHHDRFPAFPIAVVWLERAEKEQAASLAKAMGAMTGRPLARADRRRLVAALRKDTKRSRAVLRRRPCLRLRFGGVLEDPRRAAEQLAAFTQERLGVALDVGAMAAVVRPRGARCAPGLEPGLAQEAAAVARWLR